MQHVQSIHAAAHPEIFVATLDAAATAKFFHEVLSNEHNLVLVAIISDTVAGYLWCEERSAPASVYRHATRTGYINHISVDPAYRRNGLGRALVEQAFAELKVRGANRIGVDHWAFNDTARSFFDSLGFLRQREFYSRDAS